MRGIIIDIKGDRAVILQKGGVITEISNNNYIIGQKVAINSVPFKKFMLVAACFLFCCITFFGGYTTYNMPSSYVYIDINPSVRIDINCFNRIIDIVPLNEDAEALFLTYKFNSTTVEECIDEIVTLCRENHYFTEENNIEIDFVTENKNLYTVIDNTCNNLKEKEYVVESLKINSDENSKAIELKTSPKRLKAIEKYTAVFGGTVEENITNLRGVKVKEINNRIEQSSGNDIVVKEETAKTPVSDKHTSRVNADTEFVEEATVLTEDLPQNEIKEGSKKSPKKEREESARLPVSDKRLDAIVAYTEIFGGSVEENTVLLKDLSVKEIKEKIDGGIEPGREEASENSVRLPASDKRLDAIVAYTEVYGGSVEENTVLLKDLTVKEINRLTKEKSG